MNILLYHGVRPSGDANSPDIREKHVPEPIFRQQMEWIKARKHPVTLDRLLAMLRGEEPWDKRAIAITFDDGYANNAEVASPILTSLGIPATFFLTTGFLDGTHHLWVDRFEVAYQALTASQTTKERMRGDTKLREQLKRVPVQERERVLQDLEQKAGTVPWPSLFRPMTWAQARELTKNGHTLGAHTVTHPNLSRCPMDEQEQEIKTSKQRIEEETGQSCSHFAFPNGQPGDWDERTLDIIRQAGFTSCATTVEGRVTRTSDLFLLPRITVDTGSDLRKFRLTVTGWRSKLRRLKHLFR